MQPTIAETGQAKVKHRIFVWVSGDILCNQGVLVFARDDNYFFGLLIRHCMRAPQSVKKLDAGCCFRSFLAARSQNQQLFDDVASRRAVRESYDKPIVAVGLRRQNPG